MAAWQQHSTAQTCSGPCGEQGHGRLLWVSVLQATCWSVRVKVSGVGVVPLLTLGQGIGRGEGGRRCMGRLSAEPPQGIYMYAHHEIIGAAHVPVNINGGCTDACGNIPRPWQALHVLTVARRHSKSSPHSQHVYHRVPKALHWRGTWRGHTMPRAARYIWCTPDISDHHNTRASEDL